jgi:hypothetical protein
MGLGVHAGEWSALPCGSAAPPRNGTIPLQREAITHTHTNTAPCLRPALGVITGSEF